MNSVSQGRGLLRPWFGISSLALCLSLAACSGPAINPDAHTTFLNADDLVTMTDNMAAQIASDPQIAQLTAVKPMVIVMEPIQNETNEIIPQNEKWLYVHRVRTLLSDKQQLRSRFEFVLNRSDYNALQQQEGLTPEQLGTPPERVQPEYALTGTFYADTHASSQQRSDYYLCTFRLTRIAPQGGTAGEIIWEGRYETKKLARKDLLD